MPWEKPFNLQSRPGARVGDELLGTVGQSERISLGQAQAANGLVEQLVGHLLLDRTGEARNRPSN